MSKFLVKCTIRWDGRELAKKRMLKIILEGRVSFLHVCSSKSMLNIEFIFSVFPKPKLMAKGTSIASTYGWLQKIRCVADRGLARTRRRRRCSWCVIFCLACRWGKTKLQLANLLNELKLDYNTYIDTHTCILSNLNWLLTSQNPTFSLFMPNFFPLTTKTQKIPINLSSKSKLVRKFVELKGKPN